MGIRLGSLRVPGRQSIRCQTRHYLLDEPFCLVLADVFKGTGRFVCSLLDLVQKLFHLFAKLEERWLCQHWRLLFHRRIIGF